MFVLLLWSLIVDIPELLSSKPGQPTGTQFAVAATAGAVWATFNLLTPKPPRILDKAVQEIISTAPPD
jgi:hypothetical protein